MSFAICWGSCAGKVGIESYDGSRLPAVAAVGTSSPTTGLGRQSKRWRRLQRGSFPERRLMLRTETAGPPTSKFLIGSDQEQQWPGRHRLRLVRRATRPPDTSKDSDMTLMLTPMPLQRRRLLV